MPTLHFQGVSLSFDGQVPVLDAVDLTFEPGWTGLTGANGSGKSTLLRLASGDLAPDQGHVRRVPTNLRVRRCDQAVEKPDDDLPTFAWAEDRTSRRLRGRLHLDPDDLTRWATLSPGERRRWQVGAALAAEPEVLLLDEPTNHLDAEARDLLVSALQEFNGIGIVVSHDRDLLDRLTQRTVRIREGQADLKPLPWSAARVEWEREDAELRAERQARQDAARKLKRRLGDQRRERDAMQAKRSTSGRMRNEHDSDARTLGAQTLADWAEAGASRKVAITRDALERADAAIPTLLDDLSAGRSLAVRGTRAPKPVLAALDSDTIDAGGRPLLRDVHLVWRRDDRIAVTGPNGAGKSTLVRHLLDAAKLPPERVLVLPQDFGEEEAKAAVHALRDSPPDLRGRTLQLVAALGVDPDRLLATASPSHGEARKVALAHGLARDVWAVVLDEPANHLDLPSIERLEVALAAFPGALLVVTHDTRFAATVARNAWHLADGRVRVETLIPLDARSPAAD